MEINITRNNFSVTPRNWGKFITDLEKLQVTVTGLPQHWQPDGTYILHLVYPDTLDQKVKQLANDYGLSVFPNRRNHPS